MGITIRTILNSHMFKEYKLIAGQKGLDKQVQGVAILDAPDGFNWSKGRELVISSGYVFKQNPGLLENYMETEHFKNISGMGIKIDRYLKEIPEHIIENFNKYEIPLISVPMDDPWMTLMNKLNVLVLNKNIKQFKIEDINPKSFSDLSYQSRKINTILSEIEYEMNFPAMLYDLNNEKAYYSSAKFKELIDDLKLEDFWNPSFHHTQEVLCDNLQMRRYRFLKDKHEIPYSWITVPITAGNKVQAYFVVVEAMGLIDYFDQFAIRIGFLLLQSLYENMLVAQFIGDVGFEKFIIDMIHYNIRNIDKSANELGIDTNQKHFLLLMKQIQPLVNFSNYKKEIKNCANNSIIKLGARMAIVEDDSCIFLIPVNDEVSKEQFLEQIKIETKNLYHRLENKIDNIKLVFGLSDIEDSIYEFNRNYERCKQTINIGSFLFPTKDFIMYSELGPFAWMDVKEDELEIMLKDISKLTDSKEYREHINILNTYLECNMNYSLTAKKMFLHINTVRKRIEEINDLVDIDLNNPINRLKLEIILKLVK